MDFQKRAFYPLSVTLRLHPEIRGELSFFFSLSLVLSLVIKYYFFSSKHRGKRKTRDGRCSNKYPPHAMR